MLITIAIDGPSGAGKSTLSDEVAKRLDILHLDTGAMYRAAGLACLKSGISPKDEEAVTRFIAGGGADITVQYQNRRQLTLLNGENVSEDIRTEEAGLAASAVSCYPAVRRHMVALQRALAARTPMVMDGRDIGTVVLKDAKLKIFLTASPEARARRRVRQLAEKGVKADYDTVLRNLAARDKQDSEREADPLRRARDAVLLDTSDMTFQEALERIIQLTEAVYGHR